MTGKRLGKTLNTHELNAKIKPFRRLDNLTNFGYIAADYLALVCVLAGSIGFFHFRSEWGISWGWCIPVYALAVLLVGAIQHRFAGLGHEGAHYILFKNRYLNELASDLLCMFPIFATTEQYRIVHLGHHQYVNDWDRDPELTNLGKTRKMDQFPMTRWQFLHNFFVRLLWPPAALRYMWDNIYVTVLGQARHPWKDQRSRPAPEFFGFRLTSIMAVLYIFAMIGLMRYFDAHGSLWHQLVVPPVAWIVAVGVICLIPEHWFFRTPIKKPVFSARFVSIYRMGFYIALLGAISIGRFVTQSDWALYFWLLWVVPLLTAFPYYMLIRDIFQHGNADDGRLTNSRVFFVDPFTRWAFFVYGQDVHLTHHLYSGIPHYWLPKLHRTLMAENQEYREHVVECHGVFSNGGGRFTAVDVMTFPTQESEPEAGQQLTEPSEAEELVAAGDSREGS